MIEKGEQILLKQHIEDIHADNIQQVIDYVKNELYPNYKLKDELIEYDYAALFLFDFQIIPDDPNPFTQYTPNRIQNYISIEENEQRET